MLKCNILVAYVTVGLISHFFLSLYGRFLSMNDFVWGENNQVQKVSLKSETMHEKLCSIFTKNRS